MGCSVSTNTDPMIVNELKRSRHSRRRMSMDSKFIEERHQNQNDKQFLNRNETPSAGGASGRTTSTALSYETASAGVGSSDSNGGAKANANLAAFRYSNLRSIGRHRTWSHANRVNSEPNTELARRRISPSSWSTTGAIAAPVDADPQLTTNHK